jgi:hypothetical protein
MEHAYASLRREIREMSAEARNSAAGLEKINFAAKIKNQIDVTNRSFGDLKAPSEIIKVPFPVLVIC